MTLDKVSGSMKIFELELLLINKEENIFEWYFLIIKKKQNRFSFKDIFPGRYLKFVDTIDIP